MYLTSDEECQLSSWWFAQHIDVYFIIYEAKYPRNENKWAVREIREVDKESCPFQWVCKLKKHKFTHMHKSQCVLSNMCISTLIFLSSDINRPILHTSPPQKRNMPQRSKICNVTQPLTCNNSVFLACTAAFFFEKIEMPLSGMAEKIQVKEKSKYIVILSNAYYFSLRWNILTNMLQRTTCSAGVWCCFIH